MKNKKGFTLIEILIVVLIIGILAAIAMPKYQKYVTKTKGNLLIAFMRDYTHAQELYRLANGKWANSFVDLDIGANPTNFSTKAFSCSIKHRTDDLDSRRLLYCHLQGLNTLIIEKYADDVNLNCWPRGNKKFEEVCSLLGGVPVGDGNLVWHIYL